MKGIYIINPYQPVGQYLWPAQVLLFTRDLSGVFITQWSVGNTQALTLVPPHSYLV